MILDPAHPTSRLIDYLDAAQPRGWIQLEAAGQLADELESFVATCPCCFRLMLPAHSTAKTGEFLKNYSTQEAGVLVGPDDLAYIAFTSGSSGRPKGILGRHGPLSHFLPWQAENLTLSRFDRFSMLSGLSHDPLQRDIFTALWVGATICIPNPDIIGAPGLLANWMSREKITFTHLTPAMGQILTETASLDCLLPSLRVAFFVGDKLTRRDVARLRHLAPNVTCINSYGSTETQRAVGYHIISPEQEPEQDQAKAVYHLGGGIPDVQLLVLNVAQQLAGVGELGEIYVRSPHLARGYLNDETLTETRFITNPFTEMAEDKLYRTGDLGRYLPDGHVEFAGRADRQVKIRGFRIEPAEIEEILVKLPAVREAVVMARDDVPGGWGLAAYLVGDRETMPSIDRLRTFLKKHLPDYMIPVTFVILDTLPLTPNGKIDYRNLPEPDQTNLELESAFVAPRDVVEHQLVTIWEDVLEIQPIGIWDNFFELGGHSLLAILVFTQIEQTFAKKLPLAILFQFPTVAQLADIIRQESGAADWSTLVIIQPGNARPPFFCVHGFGGGVVGYAELARLLGPDQPFYGLQAHGLDGVEEPDTQIEAMAARYIQAMRRVQPTGPYNLGGYCFGGVVAFEMACQLQTQGERVGLVAIFEGYAPLRGSMRDSVWRNPRLALNFVRNMPYWLHDYLQLGYKQMWLRIRRKSRVIWKRFIFKLDVGIEFNFEDVLDDAAHIPLDHRRLMDTHIKAMGRYVPSSFPGSVTLFRVRGQSLSRLSDFKMGWGKLAASGVEVKMIAGAHHNILEQPHVQVLAQQLKLSLDNHK